MEPLDDYPLGSESHRSSSPSPGDRRRFWALVAASAVIAAAIVAYFALRGSNDITRPDTTAATPEVQQDAPQARGPLGPQVEPRELPPLDLTDPLVRELLQGLSARPELAAWLASDGLIRSFVAAVDAVANGAAPTAQLRPLAPKQPFVVEARGEEFVIDTRSYRRYDGIADMVAGLDAEGLARAYSTLRPRLQEAYRELGYPEGDFDDAVRRAIARLLNTPVLEPEVEVEPAPVLYKYTDTRIERLTPAQKQLLRMGPRNVRLVQDKLREVARALGVSS